MKKIKITSLAFLLALTLAPVLGYAKENEDKNNKHEDKKENQVCMKAFGKLIKHGWRDTQGELTLNSNCKIPYGIFKKWPFHPATSTDITAPVINSFTTTNISSSKVDINWSVNEKVRAVLFYGTTTPVVVKATSTTTGNLLNSVYSTNSMTAIDNSNLSLSGDLKVKDLIASTTYYAILAVRDSAGNVTVSNVNTFTTTNPSSDTTAPMISNILTTIGFNKLLLSWKTNEPATSKLFYGTSTINVNATTSQSMSDNTLKVNHSFELPILASTTPYHVILQATDVSGNTQTSAEYSIYFPY